MKNKHLIPLITAVMAVFLPQANAAFILGTAESFAVLGGASVTSTGNTVINGNLGVAPGTAITGFGPGIVNGTTYAGGMIAQQAQTDALGAYNILKNELVTQTLTGQDLGGKTLAPGVYFFSSTAQLTGALTLDAMGDPNARFDFQVGSALTTATGSSVLLIGGAQAGNVFWQIGSSATLGTSTSFAGSILADQSITLNTTASLVGRALALNGSVTMIQNTITVPIPEPSTLLGGLSALGILGFTSWKNRK